MGLLYTLGVEVESLLFASALAESTLLDAGPLACPGDWTPAQGFRACEPLVFQRSVVPARGRQPLAQRLHTGLLSQTGGRHVDKD